MKNLFLAIMLLWTFGAAAQVKQQDSVENSREYGLEKIELKDSQRNVYVESHDNYDPDDDIQTLLGKPFSHGFYLAGDFRYFEFDGQETGGIGGRMGWITNHVFSWGFAGYAFYQAPSYNPILEADYGMQGGYGGMVFDIALLPKFPVHLTMPITIGFGGVAHVPDSYFIDLDYDPFLPEQNYYVDDVDMFVFVEPGLQLEFNVLKHLRLGVGAVYRATSQLNMQHVAPSALEGFSGQLTMKIGKF